MKRAFFFLLFTAPALVLVGGCGPSESQNRQEMIREQRRIAADEAVIEKRREEEERARSESAVAAYHKWFEHAMREPMPEPRNYENALEHVSLEGETLVLGLSITDTVAAVELCEISLTAWPERVKHGVAEIKVVFTGDGSTLTQSTHLSNGAHICQ